MMLLTAFASGGRWRSRCTLSYERLGEKTFVCLGDSLISFRRTALTNLWTILVVWTYQKWVDAADMCMVIYDSLIGERYMLCDSLVSRWYVRRSC